MGAWGTSLYSDDTSCDVRDTFKDLVKLPVSEAELRERMIKRFEMGDNPYDEGEVDFWLALADQFYRYGLDDDKVFDTARKIITSGADLAVKRELEMSESDLAKRAKVLEALLETWSKPHPKPRKRKTIKGPEDYVFEVGDCFVYPTESHASIPTTRWNFDPKTVDQTFRPDGWGAFVVFDRWRYDDYYARYMIAVLYFENSFAQKPTLGDCREALIDGYFMDHWDLHYEIIASTYLRSPKRALRLLRAEPIGRFDVDYEALRGESEMLKRDMQGGEQGDMQLGGILALRSESYLGGASRYEPCPHLPVGRFIRRVAET